MAYAWQGRQYFESTHSSDINEAVASLFEKKRALSSHCGTCRIDEVAAVTFEDTVDRGRGGERVTSVKVKPPIEEMLRDDAMTDKQWIAELHPDLRPYVYSPPSLAV